MLFSKTMIRDKALVNKTELIRLGWLILLFASTGIGFGAFKFFSIGQGEYIATGHDAAVAQFVVALITFGETAAFWFNSWFNERFGKNIIFPIAAIAGFAGIGIVANTISPHLFWMGVFGYGIAFGMQAAARGSLLSMETQETSLRPTSVCGMLQGIGLATTMGGMIFGGWLQTYARSAAPLIFAMLGIAMSVAAINIKYQKQNDTLITFAKSWSHTVMLVKKYTALLIGGGIVWGAGAAVSLASIVLLQQHLNVSLAHTAGFVIALGGGSVAGALLANRTTRYGHKSVWIIACALALCTILTPFAFKTTLSAVIFLLISGGLFATLTTILDTAFLTAAGKENLSAAAGNVQNNIQNLLIAIVGLISGAIFSITDTNSVFPYVSLTLAIIIGSALAVKRIKHMSEL